MRLPLLFTLALLIPALLADIYITFRIPKQITIKGKNRDTRKYYIISAIITILLLVCCICLPKRNAETSIIPVMWILYTWVSIYFPKFIYIIFDLIGRIPELFKKKALPIGKYAGFPLAVICFLALWWGAFFGRKQIMVSEVSISSEKIPPSFDGFRIVQFSDAHVGTWGNDITFISKLTERINSLNPDIIVFTGDLVNRRANEAEPFVEVLSTLKAKYGVYSVMGNHDYGDYTDWESEEEHRADAEKLRDLERKMGWTVLDNSTAYIKIGNDSIALIGVENWGEPPFKQYGNLKTAYPHNEDGKIKDNIFKILLTHNPMHWHEEVRNITDIDLSLSGHTHAMQIMLGKPGGGISPSALKYPEWGGLYEFNDPDGNKSQLYINIGCGEVAIPMRIGATPEITLVTLHSKK